MSERLSALRVCTIITGSDREEQNSDVGLHYCKRSHGRNAAKKHGLQRLCYHKVEACCLLDGIDGGVCTWKSGQKDKSLESLSAEQIFYAHPAIFLDALGLARSLPKLEAPPRTATVQGSLKSVEADSDLLRVLACHIGLL